MQQIALPVELKDQMNQFLNQFPQDHQEKLKSQSAKAQKMVLLARMKLM